MYKFKIIARGILMMALIFCPQNVQALPKIRLKLWAQDFQQPVAMTITAGDKQHVYIVEQAGRIFRLNSAGERSLFLDIRDRVQSGGEKGLLSLAFHPDYPQQPQIFVNYTSKGKLTTVISTFSVSKGKAQKLSESVILRVPQPYGNHNGGQIAFGPDRYLYIGMGDGGAANDPQGHGQNKASLLGKMLRIDIAKKPYAIPKDNPFVGQAGVRPEIWALGLRNPWRFSFDRQSHQLWLADVGQNKYEEIQIIQKGRNYGWNIMEGVHCFLPPKNCVQAGLSLPLWEYDHRYGQSITGGYVYRGRQIPGLQGVYLFGDFVSGRVWGFKNKKAQLIFESQKNISAFAEDHSGELYILHYGGQIYKVIAP